MNADRLARWYRIIEYCAFGRSLERARFAFLPRLTNAGSILIFGEGDGRALEQVLNFAPSAAIDVVEASAQMIALTRHRVSHNQRVRFVHGDARTAGVRAESYDAVITFFFLDCFSEDEAGYLIAKLTNALSPGGLWLMSDFAIPAAGWRRLHASLWLAAMYRFFRITTRLQTNRLPPIGKLLFASGMIPLERRKQRAGMIVSELWRKPR